MKILVTGAKGFIGQNLIERLKENKELTIFPYDIDSSPEELDKYTKECDFVYHLAGVNRPKDEKEFLEGNFGFTSVLLNHLKKHKNKSPVMISSSIQAVRDNSYGLAKAGEDLMLSMKKKQVLKYIFLDLKMFLAMARPTIIVQLLLFHI